MHSKYVFYAEFERSDYMSINKNTYGIIGYDLTKRRDKLLTEDVCESKWYENLNCYQRKGNIQIFDDPMSGNTCISVIYFLKQMSITKIN